MNHLDAARTTNGLGAGALALRIGVFVVGLAAPGLAAAQAASWSVNPGLQDTWTIQLGAYIPSVDTTAHLNSTSGSIGTSVSLEDDLGFSDRKTLGSFYAAARLGQRWKIELEYFQLNRSSSRAISKTIEWGDQTYPFSTVVQGEFDSTTFRLSGDYSFVKNDHGELGVALGLFTTKFKASLSAAGFGGQTGDTLAPLPTIGFYGAYALSPRWLLTGRIDYFSLSYEDYDGSLKNVNAGIDYRIARNFGIGAGYRYVDYDLTVTKSKFNGGIRYKFSGPTVYAIASF